MNVALKDGSSARGFCQDCTADVAGYFVDCVAEDQLLVATFGAFNAYKRAARLGNKFVPFTHLLSLLLLCDVKFPKSYAVLVPHVAADFAL